MLSPQAHISTPPPYHTHHQTNSCFLWFIHLKQAKTVSQSTFGFQGSLRLAWHHATINHLQMTDDTLELRAADMPVPAQDMRQIPFVCLFFHFLSLRTPLCYLCQATSREARPQDSHNSKRSSTRQRWTPAKIPMDSLTGSEASVHVCRTVRHKPSKDLGVCFQDPLVVEKTPSQDEKREKP